MSKRIRRLLRTLRAVHRAPRRLPRYDVGRAWDYPSVEVALASARYSNPHRPILLVVHDAPGAVGYPLVLPKGSRVEVRGLFAVEWKTER